MDETRLFHVKGSWNTKSVLRNDCFTRNFSDFEFFLILRSFLTFAFRILTAHNL